jgi:hypothetical protein
MPLPLKLIRYKIRLIAGVITALLAIGGGVGALAAYTDYLPATRGYAKDIAKLETDSALMVATARIGNLQRESGETRLQLNQMRREGLRSARWNLTEQLKIAPDLSTRRVLQERIEQIDDDLRDVNAERDRLKAFSLP